jgi:hypothetical protein
MLEIRIPGIKNLCVPGAHNFVVQRVHEVLELSLQ